MSGTYYGTEGLTLLRLNTTTAAHDFIVVELPQTVPEVRDLIGKTMCNAVRYEDRLRKHTLTGAHSSTTMQASFHFLVDGQVPYFII